MKGRMTVGAGRYICFRVGKIEVVSGKLIFLVKQALFIEPTIIFGKFSGLLWRTEKNCY